MCTRVERLSFIFDLLYWNQKTSVRKFCIAPFLPSSQILSFHVKTPPPPYTHLWEEKQETCGARARGRTMEGGNVLSTSHLARQNLVFQLRSSSVSWEDDSFWRMNELLGNNKIKRRPRSKKQARYHRAKGWRFCRYYFSVSQREFEWLSAFIKALHKAPWIFSNKTGTVNRWNIQ